MPGLIRESYDGADALDYLQWLSRRENDLAAKPHWLELGPPGSDESPSEPAAPQQVTARPRDNISRLVGTSDPTAIGAFARLNNLRPGDSTIYAGRSYSLPAETDGSDADRGEGLLMIRRDNNRLAEIRAQDERAERERQDQSDQMSRFFDQTSPFPASQARPRSGPIALAPNAGQTGDELNRNPVVREFAGLAADEIGHQLGLGRGAYEMVRDTGHALKPIPGLANPYMDIKIHGFKDSGLGNIYGTAMGAADLGHRVANDLGMVPRAIGQKLHEMNVELNPLATPTSPTAIGEFQRRLPIASNQGKLAFDVGTLADAGAELRMVNGLNKVREALYGPELLANYDAPTRAALNELYKGMGSHFVSRAFGDKYNIPKWIIDSPFNVSKPPGLTKGEFYMYHSMFDPKSRANRLPNGLSRKAWKFSDFDTDPFGPGERLIYGAPSALKGTVSGVTGGASGFGRYALNKDSSN